MRVHEQPRAVVGFGSLVGILGGLLSQSLPVWPQGVSVTSSVVVTQEYPETAGVVDWTHRYVEAKGSAAWPQDVPDGRGELMARRGAIMDAQRNLLETVLGVQVTSNSVMRNFVVESDEVRTRVSGKIRGAKIVSEGASTENHTYEVVMRISLQNVAGVAHEFEEALVGTHPDWSPAVVPTPETPSPQPPPPLRMDRHDEEGPYTGLIIDCRGLDLRPAMSPKIRSEDGRVIWGTVNVSREYVLEHGIVGYLRDVKDISHPAIVARCGSRPLILRALSVAGTMRCDPVLSATDAERLRNANGRDGFLARLAVAFLK